jgi:hypothetical protein
MMLLLAGAALVALCLELGRIVRREHVAAARNEAARRLRERFARGAIDVVAYDQAMADLQRGVGPIPRPRSRPDMAARRHHRPLGPTRTASVREARIQPATPTGNELRS